MYVLLIEVVRPVRRRVGALGLVAFDAGRYAYAGSARRGLHARVARHMRRAKPRRWHIDFLTTAVGTRVLAAALFPGTTLEECALNMRVRAGLGGVPVAAGLGASDCVRGCGTHLWRVHARTTASGLLRVAPGGIMFRGSGAHMR